MVRSERVNYNYFYFLDGLTHLSDVPFSSSRVKISWYKDGHPINTANPIISSRIQIFGPYLDQLKINSVRPEDVGLYQCFLTTNTGQEFQAASELRLGGIQIIIVCNDASICTIVKRQINIH